MKKVLVSRTAAATASTCASKVAFLAKPPTVLPVISSFVTSPATPKRSLSTSSSSSSGSTVGNNDTYQQRKSMQTAYGDIFKALLRLPDKLVQQRVMNAINGKDICSKCSGSTQRSVLKKADAGTQTDSTMTISSVFYNNNEAAKIDAQTTQHVNTEETPATASPARRRRRRKVCEPQVIKKSHVQLALAQPQQMQPKILKRKSVVISESQEEHENTAASFVENLNFEKRARSDSLSSLNLVSDLTFDLLNYIEIPEEEHIIKTMAKEFVDSETVHDGLMPIHESIANNNTITLRRQIFIWKNVKNVDLNELITADDEDCLQLAIIHDCSYEIFDVLLKCNLNVNCTDAHSNTAIHLALVNKINFESFSALLQHIDLSMLLKLNDDGYTALHLAVRNDLYIQTEILFDVVDARLSSKSYECSSSRNSRSKAEFLKYYVNACEQQQHLKQKFKHKLKRKLLETGEMRSGNTALFFAIENRMEHFIYFLLAHFADPRIQNHSGQDAKSYLSEFGRVLNLSLKIDKAMENVINLL